jgi:hypothetical protein
MSPALLLVIRLLHGNILVAVKKPLHHAIGAGDHHNGHCEYYDESNRFFHSVPPSRVLNTAGNAKLAKVINAAGLKEKR